MQIRNSCQFLPLKFEPNARARSAKGQISTDLHPMKVEKKEIEDFKSLILRHFYEPEEPDNVKLAQILFEKFHRLLPLLEVLIILTKPL